MWDFLKSLNEVRNAVAAIISDGGDKVLVERNQILLL